jgi:hypothetical protein
MNYAYLSTRLWRSLSNGHNLHAFLTSAAHRNYQSLLRSDHFILRERTPGTHCKTGLMGHRESLEAVARRKTGVPCWKSNPAHPLHSRITTLTDLSLILSLIPSYAQFPISGSKFSVSYLKLSSHKLIISLRRYIFNCGHINNISQTTSKYISYVSSDKISYA